MATDPLADAASVRAAHGYVSMQITSLADLTAFLSKTQWLSQLSVNDSGVQADGWSWQMPLLEVAPHNQAR